MAYILLRPLLDVPEDGAASRGRVLPFSDSGILY